MPSASNTTVVNAKLPASNGKEKDTKMDLLEPFQQVVTLIEHKIRNMEKRKGKLDGYKQEQEQGKELNSDQLTAVAKYGELMQSLEFARDLSKQVSQIQLETSRMIKKQQKKDYAERVSADAERSKLLCQFTKWINVYKNVPKVRDDFANGTNGATTLKEDEVAALNEISNVSIISSLELGNGDAEFRKATEYLNFLIDGKSSTIPNTTVTYQRMKGVLISMIDSGYVYDPNPIHGNPNENGSNDNDGATQTEKETKVVKQVRVSGNGGGSSDPTLMQSVPCHIVQQSNIEVNFKPDMDSAVVVVSTSAPPQIFSQQIATIKQVIPNQETAQYDSEPRSDNSYRRKNEFDDEESLQNQGGGRTNDYQKKPRNFNRNNTWANKNPIQNQGGGGQGQPNQEFNSRKAYGGIWDGNNGNGGGGGRFQNKDQQQPMNQQEYGGGGGSGGAGRTWNKPPNRNFNSNGKYKGYSYNNKGANDDVGGGGGNDFNKE